MVSDIRFPPIVAIKDEAVWNAIQQYLRDIILMFDNESKMGIEAKLRELLSECEDASTAQKIARDWLSLFWSQEIWYHLSQERAKIYGSQIAPWIKTDNFLDIGCGNGFVGMVIEELTKSKGIYCDTIDYRISRNRPFLVSTESNIPLASASVGTVVLSAVLHHAKYPSVLFSEACRIARQRVIVKESVFGEKPISTNDTLNMLEKAYFSLNNEQQYLYTCFIDWFYNNIFERDVAVPFGFKNRKEWLDLFNCHGTVEQIIQLGLDDKLGALYHVLYIISV